MRRVALMQALGSWAPPLTGPTRWEDIMSDPRLLVEVTGRMRCRAAIPGHWAGCAPPNKGQRYPADPPTVEDIIFVMRPAGPRRYADRTRVR
jgi:hypothetical protein